VHRLKHRVIEVIAAFFDHRSHDEFVAKLGIVSEEADESVFWLTRLLNAKINSTTVELGTLLSEAEQLARIFGASHRTAKKRKRR
jgi:four helix bundle protein